MEELFEKEEDQDQLSQEVDKTNSLPDMSDMSGSAARQFIEQGQGRGGGNPLQRLGQKLEGVLDTAQVNTADFIDNTFQGDQRTKEEIKADQDAIYAQGRADMDEIQQKLNQEKGFVPELVRASTGGLGDAIESVGDFANLSYDTLKYGMNSVLGKKTKDERNPFSGDYEERRNYLEIPDVYEPQNQTKIGQMARALYEFGFLVKFTGGPGAISKTALTKAGLTKLPILKSSAQVVAGNKPLQFITKAGRVFGEGGAAELISQSSTIGNIINAANQYVPYLVPPIIRRLAVNDDDSPWEAKLKTVTAGGSLNQIGWFLSAFFRHGAKVSKVEFNKARKQGKSLTESVRIGNEAGNNEVKRRVLAEMLNQERATQKLAKTKVDLGIGIDPTDPLDRYIRNHLDDEDLKAYLELVEFNSLEGVDRVQFAKNKDEIFRYTDLAKRIGARKGDVWDDVKYSSTNLDIDNSGRQPDPHVNSDQFDDFEKSTYAKNIDAVDDVVKEAKNSPEIETNLFDEADILNAAKGPVNTSRVRASNTSIGKELLNRASLGDKNIREIMKETVDEIESKMIKTYSGEDYEALAIQAVKRAEPILRSISRFTQGEVKDLVKSYKKNLTLNRKNKGEYREYSYGLDKEGNPQIITTIGPIQKDANLIILRSLGKTMANLSAGTLEISNGMPVITQFEKLADLMKVIFKETKQQQYAWGIDGLLMKEGDLNVVENLAQNLIKKRARDRLAKIGRDADILHKSMIDQMTLAQKTGNDQGLQDLIRLFYLSDGDVISLTDVGEYLKAKTLGGSFFGYNSAKGERYKALPSKLNQELLGVMYNGLLSRIITPVKAVLGTGFLSSYRPIMKAIGIAHPYRLLRNKFSAPEGFREIVDVNAPKYTQKEIAIALAEVDGLINSIGESLAMFGRNYKLGIKGMDTDYVGRYAIKRDRDNFIAHGDYIKRYGSKSTQVAYNITKFLQDANTHWISRHSTISMAAGDAAARTSIGHQMMYARAARDLIEDGVDLKDLKKYLPQFTEQYRRKIFKEIDDGDGVTTFVTSDKMAKLAGDEATLTKSLTGTAKAFEILASTIPGSRLWFKFLTPAVNGLELAFLHTPFAVAHKKYLALVRGNLEELEKLGIKKGDIPQELAFMEGRMATGSLILTYAAALAAQGRLIGDYPRDPGKRAMWQQAGIKPNSLVYDLPNGEKLYVDISKLEVFNVLFSTTANVIENMHGLGETLVDESLAKLSVIFGNLMLDNGPLGGLEEITSLLTSESPTSRVEATVAGQIGQFIPMSGSMNDFADLIDGSLKEAKSINEKIMRRSGVAELALPQKYDIFNEERVAKKLYTLPENILLRGFNLVFPIGIDFEKDDPITDYLMEIEYDLNANLTSIDGVDLNATELSELNRLLATDKFLRKDLLKVINSKTIQKSLKDYREQRRRTNQSVMSKDGLLGVVGDDVGGFDPKKEMFYYEIDNVFERAKERAKVQMLLPNSPFANPSDPNSLRSRILAPKLRERLSQKGFSASEVNKRVKEIIELGGSTP